MTRWPAYFFCLMLIAMVWISCSRSSAHSPGPPTATHTEVEEGNTIGERFPVPEGYERVPLHSASFGHYLRHLPLKPQGAVVHYYDGGEKTKSNVYLAVVDMEIGTKDLQQCADAVIRLRSEYLYKQGRYTDIHFNYTSGFRSDYSKWREGYRVTLNGNAAGYVHSATPSYTYETFRKYLDNIFTYAGTASLVKELKSIPYNELQPGDVLIRGGSPGHAVLVVDAAVNPTTHQKVYMLVQSYMPAQEIQVLCNPEEPTSPWYLLDANASQIETPEWVFRPDELRRFP